MQIDKSWMFLSKLNLLYKLIQTILKTYKIFFFLERLIKKFFRGKFFSYLSEIDFKSQIYEYE